MSYPILFLKSISGKHHNYYIEISYMQMKIRISAYWKLRSTTFKLKIFVVGYVGFFRKILYIHSTPQLLWGGFQKLIQSGRVTTD